MVVGPMMQLGFCYCNINMLFSSQTVTVLMQKIKKNKIKVCVEGLKFCFCGGSNKTKTLIKRENLKLAAGRKRLVGPFPFKFPGFIIRSCKNTSCSSAAITVRLWL